MRHDDPGAFETAALPPEYVEVEGARPLRDPALSPKAPLDGKKALHERLGAKGRLKQAGGVEKRALGHGAHGVRLKERRHEGHPARKARQAAPQTREPVADVGPEADEVPQGLSTRTSL